MNDWKAIDLEVTRVNMLIQTVGDIRVPQRERGGLRAEPCRGDKRAMGGDRNEYPESQQRKPFPNGCGMCGM